MSCVPLPDDLLDRDVFADRLLLFLETERQFVEGALVVTLQAPFGSGKTYFLRKWQERLKANKEGPKPIVLNAWESDYCNDPLLAIISAIHNELTEDKGDKDAEAKWAEIKEALKDVWWFGLGLANSFIASTIGINAVETGQQVEEKKEKREAQQNTIPDVLESFEKKQSALATIKNALKTLFKEDKLNTIIMVDELDRCRPDYAISYLETIKHIFDIPGLVFVLAVDLAQLQTTAKSLFGNDMNFNEYLRKFVQRRIDLPDLKDEYTLERIVKKYYAKYVETEIRGTQFPDALGRIKQLFLTIKPNFRQAQEIFRIIGHLYSCKKEKTQKERYNCCCWFVNTLLLPTLHVTSPDFFESLRKNTITVKEACSQLYQIAKEASHEHKIFWIGGFAFGCFCASNSTDSWDQVWEIFDKTIPIPEETRFSEMRRCFGDIKYYDSDSRVSKICTHIKEISAFGG